MIRHIGLRSRVAAIVIALATVVAGLTVSAAPASAAPLTGAQFDPGFIIHDAQFYDSDAMTEAEIQAFLAAKSGSCSNSNCLDIYRQSTTTREATTRCLRYEGAANEPAARIIYKVQRACGISAKALMVTLQKEQSLITSTGPSDLRLRIAMGYGCPDTAPCDALYYGFFNQVYSAASQFQRYRLSPGSFKHQIGVESIYYHPNSFVVNPPTCGSRTVTIRNAATAGLYNYTPYTPNAAALSNLYGTGDACSSYGNRNFWRFYFDWFGDPTLLPAEAAIAAEYSAEGGSTGPLGAAIAADTCTTASTSCLRQYADGTIYWSSATGADAVIGAIDVAYRASGGPSGPLGYPSSDLIQVTSNPNGAGSGQSFQQGTIYRSAAGAFPVVAEVRAAYWAAGSNSGSLGWPTGVLSCTAGACSQPFQGGSIFDVGAAAHVVPAASVAAWSVAGGASTVGLPTGPAAATTANGGGTVQSFTKGAVYASPAGAFAASGPIHAEYLERGGPGGERGWPTSDSRCSSGVCSQLFQSGGIIQSTLGTFSLTAAYLEVHRASGGTAGALGLPRGDRIALPAPSGAGNGQTFERGTIYEGPTGPFAVTGALRTEYAQHGSYTGVLGWPTESAACDGAVCAQRFQGGTAITGPTGAFAMRSGFDDLYRSTGGVTGSLGLPRTEQLALSSPRGAGTGQTFERGTVYAGPAGPIAVVGAMRSEYGRQGSYLGVLGWPTAAESCVGAICEQRFQGGTIYRSGTTVRTVRSAYDVVYRSLGGPAGAFGLPTGDFVSVTTTNGAGNGQQFQRGTIYGSAAGVFPVSGGIRAAYWAAGSNGGRYGWPTSSPSCASGTCTQSFQGGVIRAAG